jgi:hypothetical protein
MEPVRVTHFDHLNQAKINVNGTERLMEVFALVVDDKGTQKMALLACEPWYKETVQKTLKRLFPLKFDEMPAPVTEEETKQIAEDAVQKPEENGEVKPS